MDIGGSLGLGKVTREVFIRSVEPYIPLEKEIELDGATVGLTDRTVIAHSPSIGVPLEALGFFAFHYAASNVACRFGRPTHMITGIYLPIGTSEKDLKIIAKGLGDEAVKYGVKIAAGQTATYYGLEIPFVSTTCLGEQTRRSEKAGEGDHVFLVGEVGGEAVWLMDLSKGVKSDQWKNFTALPTILKLHSVKGIKIFHDVSEGGVKGALLEVTRNLNLCLDFNPDDVAYDRRAELINNDILRSPSYGALIIVADPDSEVNIERVCTEIGVTFSKIGSLRRGSGLYVNSEPVLEGERVEIDEIYGSFRRLDEREESLKRAFKELEGISGAEKLIPEVGLNMVYASDEPESAEDIVGLNGRVVVSKGRPLVCGEVEYGGSKFLASVIIEVKKFNSKLASAVVLRGGEENVKSLVEIGKKVIQIPKGGSSKGCPVADYISYEGVNGDAFYHPGGFGVEPTIILVSETPEEIIEVLRKLAMNV